MATEATLAAFEDERTAKRTVRFLRRSGLHSHIEQVAEAFEVVVPVQEEERALGVLQALERIGEPTRLEEQQGWARVRGRLLNVESVGVVVAVAVVAVLLAMLGIWIWSLSAAIGWAAVIALIVAGLIFFHFSGIPHSAVKSPRPYSHKHDVTMVDEQQVQYRLAWAREEYRKSREWSRRWSRRFRRMRSKE